MIGYARAIGRSHGVEDQIQQLLDVGAETVHLDIRTGASTIRPALDEALTSMSNGDVLVVTALDRLARGFNELFTFVGTLERRGLELVALSDGIDTRHDDGAFYRFAAAMLAHHERAAKDREFETAAPTTNGQPGPKRSITGDTWNAVYPRYQAGELTGAEAAALLGVNRATFFREKARRERAGG